MSITTKRGFTLIEILLVVGLISVLASIGMVTFNKANQRQKLSAQTDKVVDYLQLTQSYAAAGVSDIASGTVFAFYFQAVANDKTFEYGELVGNSLGSASHKSLESNLSLQDPVKFASTVNFPNCSDAGSTGTCWIYFSTPLGKVTDANLALQSFNKTVSVCLSGIGYYTITIEPTGRIYKGNLQTGSCP